MARCPEGHDSSTTDYCSICGTPMSAPTIPDAAEPAPPAPPVQQPTPQSAAQTCPVCGTVSGPDVFFCETCGYDFLTGSLPRGVQQQAEPDAEQPVAADEPAGPPEPAQEPEPAQAEEPRDEEPAQAQEPGQAQEEPAQAEPPPPAAPAAPPVTTFDLGDVPTHAPVANPLLAEPAPQQPPPAPKPETTDLLSLGEPERDLPNPDDLRPIAVPPRPGPSTPPPQQWPTQPAARAPQPMPRPAQPTGRPQPQPPTPRPEPRPAAPARPQPTGRPAPNAPRSMLPSSQGPARWVAEVWIDPEWYRLQQAPEQLPSPGQPMIQALRKPTIVIGRTSAAGRPDLDCVTDTGVSRRQAALTTDGSRWFVEDLGSSNGTYLGQVDQPLPTQPISGRVELGPHDRIYVGSWTRIVVRPALVQEAQL